MSIVSVIADRSIVDHVCACIGSELDVGRAVEAAASVEKCLIAGGVTSESLNLESQWLPVSGTLIVFTTTPSTRVTEIDQLDLVSHFGCGVGGIGRREPEVALERVQHRTRVDRSSDKR